MEGHRISNLEEQLPISLRFRALRRKRKVSREEMYKRTGISIQSIEGFEKNRSQISLMRFKKMMDVLNGNYSFVIDGTGQIDLPDEREYIITYITQLLATVDLSIVKSVYDIVYSLKSHVDINITEKV